VHIIRGLDRVKLHKENDMDRRGNGRKNDNRHSVNASPFQGARKDISSGIQTIELYVNDNIPFTLVPRLWLQNSNAGGQRESHS